MIELPENPAPTGVEVGVIDYGMTLRPSTGAAALRVNRAGSRYRVAVTWPPMQPDTARVFLSRFQQGQREGLRIDYPLLGLSQGSPGSPVVDGANPTGTTLPVRGLTPGYAVKEGYALTLIDASGVRYLHFAAAPVMASATGTASLTLTLPIRAPLADGSTILLSKPTVEGLVTDIGWTLSVDRLVRLGGVTIEESA